MKTDRTSPEAPTSGPGAGPGVAWHELFVGRTHELGVLRAALAAAMGGRGRVVLLAGEPGIGKSRTAEQFLPVARAAGAEVLVGRCYEGEGAPPFWPWVQVLRAYVAARDATTLRRELGAAAPDVAAVSRELRARLPDLPAPQLEDERARFRLFDGLRGALATTAASRPVVLLLDDLHGADTPSLLLLQFLARHLRDSRILIVGALREMALVPGHPLSETLGELVREQVTEVVEFRGLSEDEVGQLVSRVTGQAAPAHLVADIHERTEGNPLYVTEVVRALVATGHVEVPSTVRAAIVQRLRGLSSPCRDTLTVAALFGREFQADAVARTGAQAPATVLARLDEAATARVVAPVVSEPGRWRFTHALIGETLADGLGMARRMALHRAAAAALAAEPRADAYAAEIAHHYFHAGPGAEPVEAVRWCHRAGEAALGLMAYEEAARLLRMALAALDWSPESDRAERARVLLALGGACKRAGDTAAAREAFLAAAAVARDLGAADLLTRAALGFAPAITLAVQPEPDPTVNGLLEEAIAKWEGRDSALHACALARLALGLIFGDGARRAALSERAMTMARRLGDPTALRQVLIAWMAAFNSRHDAHTLLPLADELARLAEESGDLEALAMARLWRCVDLVERGDRAGMRREVAAFLRLVAELRQPAWSWYGQHAQFLGAALDGRLDDAERHACEAAAVGTDAFPFAAWGYRVAQTLYLRVLQGEPEGAIPDYQMMAEGHPAPNAFSPLAWAAAELGREDEARRIVERITADDFAAIGTDVLSIVTCIFLAETCAFLRDVPRAQWLYDHMTPLAARWVVWAEAAPLGPAAYHLGILARTLGRLDDAAAHLEFALATATDAGTPIFVARSQYALADVLLARDAPGDRERAHALLAAAGATAEAIGMKLLRARVLARQTAPAPDPTSAVFRHEGDVWTIAYAGRVIRVRDARGLGFLGTLLRHPGRRFHATELVGNGGAPAPGAVEPELAVQTGLGAAGAALDGRARTEYRERLRALDEELAEAERLHDLGRQERAQTEWEALRAALVDGARRAQGSSAERARTTVTKGIKTALERIAAVHPALGEHLAATVRRGYFCAYLPDPRHPITWSD